MRQRKHNKIQAIKYNSLQLSVLVVNCVLWFLFCCVLLGAFIVWCSEQSFLVEFAKWWKGDYQLLHVCIEHLGFRLTDICVKSYVYGTVHHLDSWVKRKPTWCHLFYYFIQCSFNAQLVSAVNTTILRSLRLIIRRLLKMVVLTTETCWALNEHWIR